MKSSRDQLTSSVRGAGTDGGFVRLSESRDNDALWEMFLTFGPFTAVYSVLLISTDRVRAVFITSIISVTVGRKWSMKNRKNTD